MALSAMLFPMRFKVALHRSEEGYNISVPGLPGCWSQGDTEEEALANIRDAIREYLDAADGSRILAREMAEGYETEATNSSLDLEWAAVETEGL